MKSIEKYAYRLGLLPDQFFKMTLREFNVYADQKCKQFELENELADRRTALIASILANINRDKRKKHKPFTIEDFMPKRKKKSDKPMKPEVMAEVLKAIAVACGGEVVA